MDYVLCKLWQVIRLVVKERHPPRVIQGAVDRYSAARIRKGAR